VWAALIFTLSSMPNLKSDLPSDWDLILRKMAHAFEYMMFAFLFLRAFSASGKISWIDVCSAMILVGLFAVSDEIHQSVVAGRHGSFWDATLDFVAGIIGAFVARKILLIYQDRKKIV
jgi:VanZ family protein